jgi:D-tyrosyl-tRNA(Tyr) deacylase
VRAVIQRVAQARVDVGDNGLERIVGQIGPGLLILLGVCKDDTEANANALADKIKNLRIFDDDQGKMNRSVSDIGGELLVVSQFTLCGDCRKGNRPSFTDAAMPAEAGRLYLHLSQRLRDAGLHVANGQFQANMRVSLVNDGPATFVLEL